ncbi:N-acetyltransferase, partial [Bifidobacterium longum]
HYPEYDQTIRFYESVGFERLEVFPTLWDAWNPCLVLVKKL